MFSFIHSADWQLGSRFPQFAERAEFAAALEKIRAARIATLRRVAALAIERRVDAWLIAGDFFEDHQVEEALVEEALAVLAEVAPVRVFVLPGNHDPLSGPGSVWERAASRAAPENVHIFRSAEAVPCGSAVIAGAPLLQKRSPSDPTARLDLLLREQPAEAIRVAMSHGSPAVPGQHQHDDFPIPLDAATRAGADYLALGHWHGWRAEFDGGRMVMPGTPEPDAFDQPNAGHVALVQIERRGALPRLERIRVASLDWQAFELDCTDAELARREASARIDALLGNAASTLLRVRLAGSPEREAHAAFRTWLERQVAPLLAARVVDRAQPRLSDSEAALLRQEHPLLAGVLADLEALEALADGDAPGGEDAPRFTPEQWCALVAQAKVEPAEVCREDFRHARELLWRTLGEVRS